MPDRAHDRGRRAGAYLGGLAAGFIVPVLPFLASAPGTFIRSTIIDQAARTGTAVSMAVRLANVTGLIDIFSNQGRVSLNAGSNSMFAAAGAADLAGSASLGPLPVLAAVLLAGVIAAGYIRQFRRLSQLDWLALGTALLASAAVLFYSAFFYHYADFPAPWLALSLGCAAGALEGYRVARTTVARTFAVLIALVAALQIRETFPLRQPGAEAMAHLIQPGSCVVTDQASLAIAADRFAALPPGCPDIVDALAATLVLSNGVSIQGGADKMPQVVAAWQAWLGSARYVWLSPGHASERRIPWTPALSAWFNANFAELGGYKSTTGQLYVRVTPTS